MHRLGVCCLLYIATKAHEAPCVDLVYCISFIVRHVYRWRKWVLQIVTLLALQDGSVLDAVMLWKRNVDKVKYMTRTSSVPHVLVHKKWTFDIRGHTKILDP